MTALERLRLLTGANDCVLDNELELYLEDALEFILGYIKRKTLPPELKGLWARVAAVLYNRRGMEGQSRISAGDTMRVADALPADILRLLNCYRAARLIDLYAQGSDEWGVVL